MKKYLEILLGLVLIVGTAYFNVEYSAMWSATKTFLIGGVVVMLVLIGILLLVLGISELKE